MQARSQSPARLARITPGRKLMTAGALAAAIAVGLHGTSIVAANATPAAAPSAIGALPESFADLVASVKPAVVNISALSAMPASTGSTPRFQMPSVPPGSPLERFFRDFQQQMPRMQPGMPTSAGSGFVIDPDGLIVTNHHVVKDAKEVIVTFHDGRRTEAKVVGFDEKTDLAVLEVETEEPLTAVRFGDSDATRVGDWVIAVGNPFGLGGSVTAGIVSARGRDIRSGPYDDYLQIDAPINRGNSGGPLFDRNGQVVGVNTAIFSPTGGNVGIGFAIPAAMAEDIVSELVDSGRVERGWLGVQIQSVTEDIAESLGLDEASGALVASVVPDSPAEQAGFEPGDVIVGYDGEAVGTARDLPRLVAKTDAEEKVKIEIRRGGDERELLTTIGRMPGEEQIASAEQAAEVDEETPRIGVTLAPLTDDVREHLGVEADEGVVIADVEAGSAAASRGLRAGDVILRVGRETVDAPADVAEAVREAAEAEHESVLLLVKREDGVRYVAVPLGNA